MNHRKALVTLAVGAAYADAFNRFCRRNWQAYADRHGYDLVVLDRPLDESPRALARSVSWQRCLILEEPTVAGYDQVVWLDADILIHPQAPCIVAATREGRVGAVDAYGTPTPAWYRASLQRQYDYWRANNHPFVDNLTPQEFYTRYGLTDPPDRVLQAGVMVLSPRCHAATLRSVYDRYEDKGGSEWNFEMRPLSYELVRAGLVDWIDGRFNLGVMDQAMMFYPFLVRAFFKDWLGPETPAEAAVILHRITYVECLEAMFANSFFLHFAGTQNLMPLLNRVVEFA